MPEKKAKVSLEMTTIGYTALQVYLKWKAGLIKNIDIQSTLTALGYQLDILVPEDERKLVRNLLTEVE